VWMHSLCIFDHAFLPHPKSFFVQIFSSNSYGCLLSTHEIFLSLRSGSKIKISKKLELSRLPKTKKISLSTVGIFHIFTRSTFFHMERSDLKSPTTLWSWISQILTFYVVFRKVCMGWSLCRMGLFLIKCRSRVKLWCDFFPDWPYCAKMLGQNRLI
jgi:hypothetical protein